MEGCGESVNRDRAMGGNDARGVRVPARLEVERDVREVVRRRRVLELAAREVRSVVVLAARRHPPLDEPVGGQQLEAGAAAERDQPPALARRLIRVD